MMEGYLLQPNPKRETISAHLDNGNAMVVRVAMQHGEIIVGSVNAIFLIDRSANELLSIFAM